MTTVAIVYFSAEGHTRAMAEAFAEGVNAVESVTAKVFRITGEQIENGRWQDEAVLSEVNNAEAIVIGSPTYMGGVSAQIKAFIDRAAEIWLSQGWKDKIAGGFTHSGSPSGDKQGMLLYLATHAAQHGMVWVGQADLPDAENSLNPLGSFLGAMGSGHAEAVSEADLKTTRRYGQRIAKATLAWKPDNMS